MAAERKRGKRPQLAAVNDQPTDDRRKPSGTPPPGDEYREIPSNFITVEWDRVNQIRAILRELEQGQFQRASLLSVSHERDDRLAGCWDIRVGTLLGAPVEFDPAEVDGEVTEETQAIADAAAVDWPLIFPEGSLDRLFKWGADLGFGLGELVVSEDEETGRWIPRIKVWHTQWVWYNWGTESYWLNTSGSYDADGNPSNDGAGVIELPRVDRDIYSDGHWVLYCPGGYRYAFQRGKIRATAMLNLMRQWCLRDQARFNEVYGLMVRKATVPSGATEQDKNLFSRSIRNLGSEPTVQCPVDADGNGFDFNIVGPPSGSGSDQFGGSLHYLDECIGNILLGQSASGEKKSGLGDGDQKQNESVRQDVLEKDAGIYDVLKAHVLSWWTLWNFGSRALTPTPRALVEAPVNEEKKAQGLKSVGDAVLAIKQAWPNVDLDALAAEHGIPLLAPGEAEPIEEQSEEQLTARPAPRKRREFYADRLAKHATEHAAAIMQPDIADIRRIVREAKSFDEARDMLTAKYRTMKPEPLADLIERADVLAALEGRFDVLDKL